MKAVVAAFNQEKALVGVFSVITNLRMELFEALVYYPLQQWQGGLEGALRSAEGEAESEVGELVLELHPQPLLDLRKLLLLLLGDGAHPVRPAAHSHRHNQETGYRGEISRNKAEIRGQ